MHWGAHRLDRLSFPGLAERSCNLKRILVSPLTVVSFTVAFVFFYVLVRGPEPFYYESLGTLLLAPVIYVRILPEPYNLYLLHAFAANPLSCYLVCWIPVLLLISSVSCAFYSLRRQSLVAALTSLLICLVVFRAYHWLQPLGMTYALY